MAGTDGDRSFAEVRDQMRAFEDELRAVMAARNVWVRSPAADGSDRLIGVTALPPGRQPAEPAFVPVPPAGDRAIDNAGAHLAAAALAYLLPVAGDPALLAVLRPVLRAQLEQLLETVLVDAEMIARQLAEMGMVGPGEGEGR